MNPTTKLCGLRLASCLTMAMAMASLAACGGSAYPASTLSGTVVNESGAPIADATVSLMGTSQSATTKADGHFSFTAKGKQSGASVLAVSAAGFAPQYRNYQWLDTSIALGSIQLRTVSVSQTVTLPTAAGAVAHITTTLGDAGADVSFGYQALVTPSGAVAEGNATVNLTYWHPQSDLQSIPGALIALVSNENDVAPLRTFGMLSVDVYQGTDKLQVAAGQNATLAFTVPSNMLATMLNQTIPSLYWLDPNVGLWRLQGDVGGGNVTFNPNTGVFTSQVPHFSEWNMDGTYEFQNGGCISGRVTNMCNPLQGAANIGVTVWFLGLEQLKKWTTTTDGTGAYCINVGIGPYQGDPADSRGFPVSYFISSSTDITQPGTMCDPLPQSCRTCDPMYDTWSYSPCNNCVIQKPGKAGYVIPGNAPPPSYPDCNPATPLAYVQRCHFCPGTAPSSCANEKYDFNRGVNYSNPSGAISGGCYQLQQISMRAPGCSCIALGGARQSNKSCCPMADGSPAVYNTANICVPCTRHPGDVCSSLEGCCDLADPSNVLECGDNLCVPNQDPTYNE